MTGEPVVRVDRVSKTFRRRGLRSFGAAGVQAVRDVSLEIPRGKVLGVVGESGSGKSTLGRLVVGLLRPDAGTITLDGRIELARLRGRRLRHARRGAQIIFQDSYRSLDPMMTVRRIIEEPLAIAGELGRTDRRARVEQLVELVDLDADLLGRRPGQLSGGQRQRVAIARSLATEPQLVVLDESVASLDRATQAHVLDLLLRLQDELGISYLFISHDLAAVRYVSDDVIVMYLGEIVESGPAQQVVREPRHPYTRALRSAVLVADPKVQRGRERIVLEGDPPNPADPPAGCGFSTRCPQVHDRCHTTRPLLRPAGDGRAVACHLYDTTDTAGEPTTVQVGSTAGAAEQAP